MSPVGKSLFGALAESLADFRTLMDEGEPGRQLRALGTSSGTIPDLARKLLSTVAAALEALALALQGAVDVLRVADALKALLEVASEFIGALTTGLDFGPLPEKFGLDMEPVTRTTDVAHSAMDAAMLIDKRIPSSDDLDALRKELGRLLGHRADPSLTGEGALGRLLADLTCRPP